MGPRTFATVPELLWYNCSSVCGSSAWQLCGGAIGDLLPEDLCHTWCLPGLQPEPLSLWQATADPCLCRRHSSTHRQVWLSLLWGHCSFLLGPGAHKILSVPSNCLFPQFCGSSVIKSHWLSKSHSLGVPSPFARSPGWGICCGP